MSLHRRVWVQLIEFRVRTKVCYISVDVDWRGTDVTIGKSIFLSWVQHDRRKPEGLSAPRCVKERGERERERETDRQTDRQTVRDRETKKIKKKKNSKKNKEKNKKKNKKTKNTKKTTEREES